MKKPQDSDIFGTASSAPIPRIFNPEKVDPNAQFQARMDAQYDAYSKKLQHYNRSIFQQKPNPSKVNEQANFDEHYHHSRKDADLQSSIFYEPTLTPDPANRSRITERQVPKHAYGNQTNDGQNQYNFGKKETLDREVKMINGKGESQSRIFGGESRRDMEKSGVKNVEKLIPYGIQWMQYDSVKYGAGKDKSEDKSQVQSVMESKSQLFNKQLLMKKMQQLNVKQQKQKQNNSKTINMQKKNPLQAPPQQKKSLQRPSTATKKPITIPSQPICQPTTQQSRVQIQIQKGWCSNIMQDLSKYCRLNNTKILSINFEEGGKGNLILERSKRWENITDWLRKDAKLKIRVTQV